MEPAAKTGPSAAHRARLAVTWILFVAFTALLGFGIIFYAQTSTHRSGIAMAIIGIIGIGALATFLRLARIRALANRRVIYAGRGYGASGTRNSAGMNQHHHWFYQHQMLEQRRSDDEFQQQQQQQRVYIQQQQQQQWNMY